jgi:hypothetical protein
MKKHLLLLALVFVIPSTSVADEKEEQNLVNDTVQSFLKVMKDKDIDAAMKCVSTPWLRDKEKVIKDDDELKKHLQEQMKTFNAKRSSGETRSALKYGEYKKDADETQKKFLGFANQILKDDDFIVLMVDKETPGISYLLVRQQKGKFTIASGPHRWTYLMIDNTFPQEILAVLENAEEIYLYSLDPKDEDNPTELGKTVVKNAEERKKLVAELKKGVEDSDGAANKCLWPRHQIIAVYEKKIVRLLICFECKQIYCHVDGKKIKTLVTTKESQAFFDQVLKNAGVKLAPKPKE